MRRRWIPVRRIVILGPDRRIDVEGRLIGKHELAIDDFYARAERRAARRVADREKQLTAGLEDVLERVMRFGRSPCRSPTRTTMARPASLASSTHGGKSSVSYRIDREGTASRALPLVSTSGALRAAEAAPSPGDAVAPVGLDETLETDDQHSSRRRARDRCIAGAVRESVQVEVGVEVQQRCFQRQSISRGRAIQCLPTFARMTGSRRRRTHIARRGRSMGATVRGCHAAPMQSRKQASAGST